MIRAVLDANVLVSVLINPKGGPGRIVRSLIEHRSFAIILSQEISAELRRSLLYRRVRRRILARDDEISQWVACLGVIGEIVTPTVAVRAVESDPDDDKYLAAALEGRADFIVSGDSHLLDLGRYEDIPIVTARKFLDILGDEADPTA